MNKDKIGSFLKELRKTKGLTQANVGQYLLERNLPTTPKAISDWEKGKSIPELERLLELSELYQVTPDEILEGERKENIDFSEKYPISNPQWGMDADKSVDLFSLRQEQIIKIENRFEKLLSAKADGPLNLTEEEEFRFLFEHFYSLSLYAKENYGKDGEDHYLILKEALDEVIFKTRGKNKEEILWEMEKLIVPNEDMDFRFVFIMDEVPKSGETIDRRFKALPFWKKDMILTAFQKCDLYSSDPEKYGSRAMETYQKRTGRSFDKEQISKEILSYLIDNGACINRQYLNFIVRRKVSKRIVDRLEDDLKMAKAPIAISFYDGEKNLSYLVENNEKNRFITGPMHAMLLQFDYSPEELFELVSKNDEFTQEMLLNAAKKSGIDTNREAEYVRADLNFKLSYSLQEFQKYKEKEKRIKEAEAEWPKLYQKLKDGVKTYPEIEETYYGHDRWPDMRLDFYYWNSSASLSQMRRLRMKKETEELRQCLTDLSIDEIRARYFKPEVREDE